MMQKAIIVILASLLIASVVIWKSEIDKSNSEIISNKSEIDSLTEKLSETKYNYGLSLARANCWPCHRFQFATDNYLEGVVQRVGEKYLFLYLTKQDSLINAGDPYAISLKNRTGNLGNSHNFKFSQSDLEALIEFMR